MSIGLLRILEKLTELASRLPSKLSDGSLRVSLQEVDTGVVIPLPTGAATSANQTTELSYMGATDEAVPAGATDASGLNGRLQFVSQKLVTLISKLPVALGAGGGLKVDGSGTALPVSGTFWQTTQPISVAASAEADGHSVTLGATTDAAVDTDTTGTVSGKLRGLVKLFVNLLSRWPAALGAGGGLKVDGSGTALPISGTLTGITNVVHVDDNSGSLTVDAAGDTAHDAADAGNPVKVGGKAANAWPAAVANADRSNFITDLIGRLLIGTKPNELQKSFYATYSTTQTGTAIWTPASGKKIVVTSVYVASFGSTAGTVTLWFGASGDTTFSAGTDQPLIVGRLAPGVGSAPSFGMSYPDPVVCQNADYILNLTTDANVSVHITVHGYEI